MKRIAWIRQSVGAAAIASITLSAASCARALSTPETLSGVELTAARHLLKEHPRSAVMVDSRYAWAERAPGYPSGAVRPSDRTAALAAALGASVGAGPPDGGVYLILSEPVMADDSVHVTVTAQWKGGADWRAGRSGYQTQTLVLVREGAAWRVVRVVDLGIS